MSNFRVSSVEGLLNTLSSGRVTAEKQTRPIHEAQIMELAAHFARHQREPFKPGEFITPSENSGYENIGEPHVVLQVRRSEPNFDQGHPGRADFGCVMDLEMAVVDSSGAVVSYWVDSRHFVRYHKQEQ